MSIPDSGDRDAFKTGAVRDVVEGKPRPTLLPPMIYRMLAMRATDGAAKYDDHNWAKGMSLSRYTDAIQRHLWAFLEHDGTEDHLGAIMWNAGALAWTEGQIDSGNLPQELNDLVDWDQPDFPFSRPEPSHRAPEDLSARAPEDLSAYLSAHEGAV